MDPWRFPTGIGLTLALLGGLSLAPHLSTATAVGVGSGGVLLLLLPVPNIRAANARFALATILIGLATGVLRFRPEPPVIPYHESVSVAARVAHWESTPQGVHARVEVVRVGRRRLSPPIPARLYGPSRWGSVPASPWLAVPARIVPGRGATNPGAWSFRETVLYADRQAVPQWGPGASSPLHRIRSAISEFCRIRVGGFPGRLGEAVLLGRSRALTPEERDGFRRSGASHLVAVSGLHVGLVVMLISLLLAPLPPSLRFAGITIAAFGYALLAGWAPSALRAASLVGAATLGAFLHRTRPGISWLALILPWLVWCEPGLVSSVGFRLSLGAVAGILFFLELWGSRGRRSWIVSPVAVSVGAQWGTLPVLIHVFGQLAPLATLPNLVAVPLTGLFLPSLVFSMVLSPIHPVAELFVDACRLLALSIKAALDLATNRLPFWTGIPANPPLLSVLPAVLMLIWFSAPRSLRRTSRARGAGLVLAAAFAALLLIPRGSPPGPWVAFLDVGQGDAAVVRLSDQSVWVIDVGDDRGPGDAARNRIVPFLRTRSIRGVDGLILSHRHRDHTGGLAGLLESVSVTRVFDAGFGGHRGTPARVDSILNAHRLWPCLVASGDTLHSGPGCAVVALGPPRGDPETDLPGGSLNNASLVVRVQDGTLEVLFPGDAEAPAEKAYLDAPVALRSRILKVGHHGSATSTTEAFLRAVRPEYAVVSCGLGNRFGHPRRETLERLRAHGVRVLRTDVHGAAVFTVVADSLVVETHPPTTRTAF